MWIVNNRKIFYGISVAMLLASFGAMIFFGLQKGIDFAGGTLVEVVYSSDRPAQIELENSLKMIDQNVSVRPVGTDGYIIRMKESDQDNRKQIEEILGVGHNTNETITPDGQSIPTRGAVIKSFDTIGPVLGAEAVRKSVMAVILVLVGIIFFISFAFRKVSLPVSSWKYGLIAILALIHDVIIPIGAFAVLGKYLGYEVDTLFVTALLVVLGSSVHNTIVVFDRVRENLINATGRKPFVQTVGESVSQTIARSLNTSITTIIALVALYILGGTSINHLVLVLIIGMVVGTYTSLCVAPSLLVTVEEWSRGKK